MDGGGGTESLGAGIPIGRDWVWALIYRREDLGLGKGGACVGTVMTLSIQASEGERGGAGPFGLFRPECYGLKSW